MTSCEVIFEFWGGRRHAAGDLITPDAGEHDAISLRRHACCELAAGLVGKTAAGAWSHHKVVSMEVERLLLADIDMCAGAATVFFDFGEVGALVPVGFGVVIVRKSVEARGFGDAAGDDSIRH